MALQADNEGFSDIAFQGQEAPGDERLLVKFYFKPRQNPGKSKEAGRPIFEEREYISIMVPGNKDSIIERPVSDIERKRFPRHYHAFQQNKEQAPDGTPLSDWPGITRSQVEELKFAHVHTVEQLAEVSDVNAQSFMGIQKLKARAKLFIEAAEDNAITERLASELEERDATIAALQSQMGEMIAEMKELKQSVVPNSGGDD